MVTVVTCIIQDTAELKALSFSAFFFPYMVHYLSKSALLHVSVFLKVFLQFYSHSHFGIAHLMGQSKCILKV